MNPEEINIAIAEACGWKRIDDDSDYEPYWECPSTGRKVSCEAAFFPVHDYVNDLNAMHIAQLTLKGHDRTVFRRFLHQEVMDDPNNPDNAPEFATARQRAEAFLRTLGKWEKSQP